VRTLDSIQHPSSPCDLYQGRCRGEAEGVSSVHCPGWDHRGPLRRWLPVVCITSHLLLSFAHTTVVPPSMYLIPTSMSPLIRMCIGGDNLLLIYGDRHARLWDVKTQEFWRAMTVDKADELVGQGGWAEWYVTPTAPYLFTPNDSPRSLDTPPDKSLLLSGLDTSLSTLDSGVQ